MTLFVRALCVYGPWALTLVSASIAFGGCGSAPRPARQSSATAAADSPAPAQAASSDGQGSGEEVSWEGFDFRSPVTGLAFDAAHTRLAILHLDGVLGLWDLTTAAWHGPERDVGYDTRGIAFAGSNQHLAGLSRAYGPSAWNLDDRQSEDRPAVPRPPARHFAAMSSRLDGRVALSSMEPALYVGAVGSERVDKVNAAPGATIRQLAWALEADRLAGATDDELWVWDATTRTPVRRLRRLTGKTTALGLDDDGTTLVRGTADGQVTVWSVDSGAVAATGPSAARVGAVAFRPHAATVAVATEDGFVSLRSEANLQSEWHHQHPAPVGFLLFSADGSVLVTGCDDGRARIFDAETGELRRDLGFPETEGPN